MPSLGADMDAGTVTEWRIGPGDTVRRGDIVAVVETDKADIEIESFHDGVVVELVVPAGVRVPVGTTLATLAPTGAAETGASPGEAPAAPVPAPTPVPVTAPAPAPAPVPVAPEVGDHDTGAQHRARSPLVRKLARERGVDLAHVDGTGPGGTITRDDIERAAARDDIEQVAARDDIARAGAGLQPVPSGNGERVRATPRARTLAKARGVDLRSLTGTGPAGAVTGADVEKAPEVPDQARRAADPAVAMRAAIAGLVTRSNRDIPHYYVESRLDLTATMAWLAEHNADRPPARRVLPAAVLLRAVALAAQEVPSLNGWWRESGFEPAATVDVGVVVSLRSGGLLVPVIRDGGGRGVDETMSELRDAVGRARAGRLRASELSDPSITVTNLGDLGAEVVYGVIYPPQVAIVGFGRILDQPWVSDGAVVVRPVVRATVAADHRASDGAHGARFLTLLQRALERPGEL
jgi:pyruvate dehydrogenase E2 component (dihydrolipoamide acetyltransferase)